MKILFILENYHPNIGGVETLFQNLMEGLAKKGHQIELITHRIKGTKKYEELNGVKIHRIDCLDNRYLFSFLAVPKALSMAKNFDIIHTTTYNGALPAITAAKMNKKPAIITVHEILGKHWEKFEMNKISKKMHQTAESRIIQMKFDKFIAVSNSTKKQLMESGVEEKKIEVVYDGVDYSLLKPTKYDGEKLRKKYGHTGKFVYMAFGRPGITKGIEYLIKAQPLIEKKIPKSQLILILSERDKRIEKIRELIKQKGLTKKIILLKSMKKEELLTHIKMADCIVVPSLTEGFGYAVIEACEMGKTVVASNTTSIPEVIYGKYVLVKPGSVEGLAEGVEMAYKGKTLKGKRKEFTNDNTQKGYMKIYNSLINNGRLR